MPRGKNIQNIFNADKRSSSAGSHVAKFTSAAQGDAGYDNPRENIDPHIRTQAISAKQVDISGLNLIQNPKNVIGNVPIGFISFKADNNAGQEKTYANIRGGIQDHLSGSEDGELNYYILSNDVNVSMIRVRGSGVNINDDQADADFRVETSGNGNMLVVDGGLDRVAIGHKSPTRELDVSGDVKVSGDISGATLSSSGFTSGAILFQQETGTIGDDSSNLRWDNTNNRLGVGTTAPLHQIHAESTGSGDEHIGVYRNGVKVLAFGTWGYDGLIQGGTFNNFRFKTLGNQDTEGFIFEDSSAVRQAFISRIGGAVFNENSNDADFRVESNNQANMLFVDGGTDRVGIGIGAPLNTLHLYNNTSATGASAGTGIKLEQDGTGDNLIEFLMSGVRQWLVGVDNNIGDVFRITEGVTGQFTSQGLAIDTTGKVGIGTAAPSKALEVVGDIGSTGTVSGASLKADDGATGTFTSGDATPKTITVTNGVITSIV